MILYMISTLQKYLRGRNGSIIQVIPKGNGKEYTNICCHSATLIKVPTTSVHVNHAASIITFTGGTTQHVLQ